MCFAEHFYVNIWAFRSGKFTYQEQIIFSKYRWDNYFRFPSLTNSAFIIILAILPFPSKFGCISLIRNNVNAAFLKFS